MKKLYKIFSLSLFIIALLNGLPARAAVDDNNTGVAADKVIDGNYYTVNTNVEIAGKVTSDVFAIGQRVDLTGDVAGDVFVMAGKVRIKGKIGGNVRVLAGTVEISGVVAKNILAAAGTVGISADSRIGGHVTVLANEFKSLGTISGSLLVRAVTMEINNYINGPVNLWLEKNGRLEVKDQTVIDNEFIYHAFKPALISTQARLAKGVTHQELVSQSSNFGQRGRNWLIALFGSLVLGMVLFSLTPQLVMKVGRQMLVKPWLNLGWGLLWTVVVPVLSIILILTLIGIPLAILAVLVYVGGIVVAPVLAATAAADYARSKPLLKFASGYSELTLILLALLFYHLFRLVPLVGPLAAVVVALISWGAVIRLFKQNGLVKT